VSRHQSLRWTWSELDAEVDSVASGLLRLGIGKGDRVGIWAPNRAEWAVIQFATARIGAILVTINPAYRTSEVEYALNKVGCRLLVRRRVSRAAITWRCCANWGRSGCHAEHMVALGEETFAGFMPWAACVPRPIKARLAQADTMLDRHDPINIQFTSGTTGFPKGATLTHRNILNNGYFTARTSWASRTGCASRCRSTTALAWCWAIWRRRPVARRWSIPARR
jgi:fatty-acyl-CoA synthase